MFRLAVCLIISLFLAIVCYSSENQHILRVLGKSDGLRASAISAIVESNDGLVWIGTSSGLFRYDGLSFKQFTSSPESRIRLSFNNVSCLYKDKRGRIWIGYKEGGFSVLDLTTGQHYKYAELANKLGINGNNVVNIQQGEAQKIWVFYEDTAWIEIDESLSTSSIIKPLIKNMKPRYFRGAILVSAATTWYVYGSDGVGEFQQKNNTVQGYRYSENGKVQNRIQNSINGAWQANDRIWLNTWGGGIVEFDHTSKKFIGYYRYNMSVANDGITNNVRASVFKNHEEVYVTTSDSGFGWFNWNNKTYTFPKYASRAFHSKALYRSKFGVWYGCENGLGQLGFEYQHTKSITLTSPKSEKNQRVNFPYYLTPYKSGHITSAFYSTELLQIYPGSARVLDKVSRNVLNVYPFSGDTLIAVSVYGVSLKWIDNDRHRSKPLHIPNNKEIVISSSFFTKDGYLLIGTMDGKILRWNVSSSEIAEWNSPQGKRLRSVKNGRIFDIIATPDDHIVACGEYGITIIDTKTNKIQELAGYENSNYSKCKSVFHLDYYDGKIWFTNPEEGLLSVTVSKGAKIEIEYSEKDGLPGHNITDFKLKDDTLWAICQNKLLQINMSSGKIEYWDDQNGLTISPDDWSSIEISDKHVWYSMPGRWYYISKKRLAELHTPDDIVIFDLCINDRIVYENGDDQFKYNNFKLSLAYRLNNVIRAANTSFRYRLGTKSDWVYPDGGNNLVLTNLSEGSYDLQFSYKNNTNLWSPPKTYYSFRITPPFYKSGYFFVLVFLLLSAVYYAIYSQILYKRKIISDFEAKLNKTKNEALRSQMNPHFIFNSLNSLNYYIQANETKSASVFLGKFSKLIRTVLHNSTLELNGLDEEIDFLRLYLDLEKMRFQDKLTYEIIVEKEVEVQMIKIPPMIIQPYIENAIWHGIMHGSSQGKVSLTIRNIERGIHIQVEDNGIGRKKSAALKSRKALSHKSYGTLLTAERMDIYQASTGNTVEVHIIDKEEEQGTIVDLKFFLQDDKSSIVR